MYKVYGIYHMYIPNLPVWFWFNWSRLDVCFYGVTATCRPKTNQSTNEPSTVFIYLVGRLFSHHQYTSVALNQLRSTVFVVLGYPGARPSVQAHCSTAGLKETLQREKTLSITIAVLGKYWQRLFVFLCCQCKCLLINLEIPDSVCIWLWYDIYIYI